MGAFCCATDGRVVMMAGVEMSVDDRMYDLLVRVTRHRSRDRFRGQVAPPGSPSLEQPDGGGTEQIPQPGA